MRDSINILKYWIKELRKIREFQEIARVEDIEFLRLYGETQRALNNMFIEYADEYGISRLEKVCGIYPDINDTLEIRRTRLYVYWNDKNPYTEKELRSRLENICGEGNVEVVSDYTNYLIQIITHVGGYGVFDEVARMLDYFLPANLLLDLKNSIYEEGTTGIYYGVGSATAISYTITNDINANYPVDGYLYTGFPVLAVSEHLVTNDIEGTFTSNMALNTGSSVLHAVEAVVTNDINSQAELNEEKSVSNAITTSIVITIKEE